MRKLPIILKSMQKNYWNASVNRNDNHLTCLAWMSPIMRANEKFGKVIVLDATGQTHIFQTPLFVVVCHPR
jgi:hypothetical protein